MSKLQFSKIRDVKSPSRGTSKSAGIDLFVPEYSDEFSKSLREKNQVRENYCINFTNLGQYILLNANCQILIPSGIKFNLNKGTSLIAFNKSGVFLKQGLCVGACVIDEDYQQEVHISLFNTSDKPIEIKFGQKIIQFIEFNVNYPELEEKPDSELYSEVSERKGGFGSTGV